MLHSLHKVVYDFFTIYAPHTRIAGGRDLVFLHGFMGDHRDFALLLESWDKSILSSCNIHLCDLPGHGVSRFTGHEPDLPECITAIRAALVALGVRCPIYVGYSMGGRLALALADAGTSALFLESASFGIADPLARGARLAEDRVLLQSTLAIEEPLQRKAAFGAFLQKWYNAPLFNGISCHPDFPAMLLRRAQGDPFALQKGLNLLSSGNFPFLGEKLQALSVPVALLCGERDAAYRTLARQIKGSAAHISVHEVPHCSHNIHLEQPKAFLALLSAFIRENGVDP